MQRTTSHRVRTLVTSLVAASLGSAACLSEQDAPGEFDTATQELVFALQGESQAWTTSSGDSISASSSNARLQANASGDTFSFSAAVTSGTYGVVVKYSK